MCWDFRITVQGIRSAHYVTDAEIMISQSLNVLNALRNTKRIYVIQRSTGQIR